MLTNLLYRFGLAPLGFALAVGLSGCSCTPANTCTYSPLNGGTCNDPDAGGNNYLCYAGNTLITTVCAPELPTKASVSWCIERCEADGLTDCNLIDRADNDCDCVKCDPSASPLPTPSGLIEYQCQWDDPENNPPTYNVMTGSDGNGEPIWSPGTLTEFYKICVVDELKFRATELCIESFQNGVAQGGGYVGTGDANEPYSDKLPDGTMIEAVELGPCPNAFVPYTPVASDVLATLVLRQERTSTSVQVAGQMVYGILSFVSGASYAIVEDLQLSTPGPYLVDGEEISNVTIKLLTRVAGPLGGASPSITIPTGSAELLLEADAVAADGSDKRYIARVISPDDVTLTVDAVGNASMSAFFRVGPDETLTVILSGVPQSP
ncbi:hypothetical protein [Polyangium sp. y55x31]|uniref:hypothetical protein n=1 Tax=Polyangium sp. y55x31 TaxID=3042688 RepID=UPI0024827BA8|nr:hypothetical protein [Polyangium sp. y55x31]MDI1480375.1 hypothetical protein [Polyangium sp. y55x31]